MGGFPGSAAENLTAEAMIFGWKAACKLWKASYVLNTYEAYDSATDSADRNAQENIRAAIRLLELVLEKFSCTVVYNIEGHTFDPNLHDLEDLSPEREAWSVRQMHVCCEDSNGGAVIDPLCGAAVTTVMRPGLMVSGILHVRPRVWVTQPSTLTSTAAANGARLGSPPPPNQQKHGLPAPLQSTASEIGAKDLNPAESKDVTAIPNEQINRMQLLCKDDTTSAEAAGYSAPHYGGQLATEDSEGCATWQIPNDVSASGQKEVAEPLQSYGSCSTTTATDGAIHVVPAVNACTGGDRAGSRAGVVAASAVVAGPSGPLQLLLALRAGFGGGDGSGRWKDVSGSNPRGVEDCTSEPAGTATWYPPAAHVTFPVQPEIISVVPTGDGVESSHDYVRYQQFHTRAEQPAALHEAQWPLEKQQAARAKPLPAVAPRIGIVGASYAYFTAPVMLALERAATCEGASGHDRQAPRPDSAAASSDGGSWPTHRQLNDAGVNVSRDIDDGSDGMKPLRRAECSAAPSSAATVAAIAAGAAVKAAAAAAAAHSAAHTAALLSLGVQASNCSRSWPESAAVEATVHQRPTGSQSPAKLLSVGSAGLSRSARLEAAPCSRGKVATRATEQHDLTTISSPTASGVSQVQPGDCNGSRRGVSESGYGDNTAYLPSWDAGALQTEDMEACIPPQVGRPNRSIRQSRRPADLDSLQQRQQRRAARTRGDLAVTSPAARPLEPSGGYEDQARSGLVAPEARRGNRRGRGKNLPPQQQQPEARERDVQQPSSRAPEEQKAEQVQAAESARHRQPAASRISNWASSFPDEAPSETTLAGRGVGDQLEVWEEPEPTRTAGCMASRVEGGWHSRGGHAGRRHGLGRRSRRQVGAEQRDDE